MTGAVFLYLVTYVAILVFLAAVAFKFFRISSMPMHLRWELYPVAHEPGDKPKYGGSYMEESEYWNKERKSSLYNEVVAMGTEILFLEAVFKHNRKLWWRSYPFHLGLYLLSGFLFLQFLTGLLVAVGFASGIESGLTATLISLSKIFLFPGLLLATFGAFGLLHRRLFDEDLKDYTSGADIFNLVLFAIILGLGWLTALVADPGFVAVQGFLANLITFNIYEPVGSPLVVGTIFAAVSLIAYIPCTHMAHFFIKWFTWHQIRWEDELNTRGGAVEAKVMEQCGYKMTWAAPHIKADGKKNWVDIATEEID